MQIDFILQTFLASDMGIKFPDILELYQLECA